jgi:hypothetical protein
VAAGADRDALPTHPEVLRSVEGSTGCNKIYTVATYTGRTEQPHTPQVPPRCARGQPLLMHCARRSPATAPHKEALAATALRFDLFGPVCLS